MTKKGPRGKAPRNAPAGDVSRPLLRSKGATKDDASATLPQSTLKGPLVAPGPDLAAAASPPARTANKAEDGAVGTEPMDHALPLNPRLAGPFPTAVPRLALDMADAMTPELRSDAVSVEGHRVVRGEAREALQGAEGLGVDTKGGRGTKRPNGAALEVSGAEGGAGKRAWGTREGKGEGGSGDVEKGLERVNDTATGAPAPGQDGTVTAADALPALEWGAEGKAESGGEGVGSDEGEAGDEGALWRAATLSLSALVGGAGAVGVNEAAWQGALEEQRRRVRSVWRRWELGRSGGFGCVAAEPLGGLRGEVRALMEAYNRMVASRETRSAWREVDAAFIAPEWLVGRTIKVKFMGEGGAASGDGRNANLRYSWFEARVVGYDPACLMHTVLYADGTLSVACFLLDGLAIQLHLGEVVPEPDASTLRASAALLRHSAEVAGRFAAWRAAEGEGEDSGAFPSADLDMQGFTVRRHADFATSVAALRVALGEVQRGAEGDALRAAWAAVLHPPEQRSVRCSFGGEAGAGRRARGGAGRAAVERQVKEMVAGLVDEAGGARAVADLQARATWLAGVAGQLDAGASLAEATYAPEIIAKGLACAEEVVWARAAEGVPWVAALVGTWEDLARWGGGAQRHGPADRVAVQAFAGEESDCAWVAAVAVRPFPAGLREGLASSLAPSSLGRVREYLEEDALPDMMRLQDNTGWYVEGTSQGEAVRRSDPRWAAGVPEGGLQVAPGFFLESVGSVEYWDLRYHTERDVYPIGYAMRTTVQRSKGREPEEFRCSIRASPTGPEFVVAATGRAKGREFAGGKVTLAWAAAMGEGLSPAQRRALPKKCGQDMFGLRIDAVRAFIQAQPTAAKLQHFRAWLPGFQPPSQGLTPEEESRRPLELSLRLRLPPGVTPQPQPTLHSGACHVCHAEEEVDGDLILHCDACRVAVHMSCYGIAEPRRGGEPWLCAVCAVGGTGLRPPCALCPCEGGAMKPTTCGQWAHVACALWVPEVGFEDPSRLEPIDGLASVPPARWALRCCLCRQPHGAPIQCAGNAKCARAFHPLCARAKGLVMEEATPLPSGQGRPFQGGTQCGGGVYLAAYCKDHAGRAGGGPTAAHFRCRTLNPPPGRALPAPGPKRRSRGRGTTSAHVSLAVSQDVMAGIGEGEAREGCARSRPIDSAARRGIRAPDALQAMLDKRRFLERTPYAVTGCRRVGSMDVYVAQCTELWGASRCYDAPPGRDVPVELAWDGTEEWGRALTMHGRAGAGLAGEGAVKQGGEGAAGGGAVKQEVEGGRGAAGRGGKGRGRGRGKGRGKQWSEAAWVGAGAGRLPLQLDPLPPCAEGAVTSRVAPGLAPRHPAWAPGCEGRAWSAAERFALMHASVGERVVTGKSAIHGLGAFARLPLRSSEMVVEYVGELVRGTVADLRERRMYDRLVGAGTYVFKLNEAQCVDATVKGNLAHLLNHSCDPNCRSATVTIDSVDHVVIFTMRDVAAGEELTYDYRFSGDEVLTCNCGAQACRGRVNKPASDAPHALLLPWSEVEPLAKEQA